MDLRLKLYGCPAQHQTPGFFVLRHSNTALAASLGWAGLGSEPVSLWFQLSLCVCGAGLGWAVVTLTLGVSVLTPLTVTTPDMGWMVTAIPATSTQHTGLVDMKAVDLAT